MNFTGITTETVEEIMNHNDQEWQSGHIMTEDKPEDNEKNDNKGSKLWILGVVLGVLAFVLIVVLVSVFYVRKIRYVFVQCLTYANSVSMLLKVPNDDGWLDASIKWLCRFLLWPVGSARWGGGVPLAGHFLSKSCSFSPETQFTTLKLASKSEFA